MAQVATWTIGNMSASLGKQPQMTGKVRGQAPRPQPLDPNLPPPPRGAHSFFFFFVKDPLLAPRPLTPPRCLPRPALGGAGGGRPGRGAAAHRRRVEGARGLHQRHRRGGAHPHQRAVQALQGRADHHPLRPLPGKRLPLWWDLVGHCSCFITRPATSRQRRASLSFLLLNLSQASWWGVGGALLLCLSAGPFFARSPRAREKLKAHGLTGRRALLARPRGCRCERHECQRATAPGPCARAERGEPGNGAGLLGRWARWGVCTEPRCLPRRKAGFVVVP